MVDTRSEKSLGAVSVETTNANYLLEGSYTAFSEDVN